MKYEIREESVHLEGYVNITERDSEVLFENGERFVEQTVKGMWKRAIDKTKSIPMLLNHSWDKKIATTEDSLELYEDEIGLRFTVDITDEEAIESIKRKGISGCSFGFRTIKEKKEQSNKGCIRRFLEEIQLLEVSILSGKKPAYSGSLAEVRDSEEEAIELRIFSNGKLEDEEVRAEENLEQEIQQEKLDDKEDELEAEAETEDDTPMEQELDNVDDEAELEKLKKLKEKQEQLRAYVFLQRNK